MTDIAKIAAGLMCLALAGCDNADLARYNRQRQAEIAQFEYERAYDHCIHGAVGYFGSASIEVVKHCEDKARAHIQENGDGNT